MGIEEQRLKVHYARQDALEKNLTAINARIEDVYASRLEFENLKRSIKDKLREQVNSLTPGKKLAIDLVDIQNDFVLDGFGLYAPGGENTVTSNMALLDAIWDLSLEDGNNVHKIELVTSQDVHDLGRVDTDNDYQAVVNAYPDTYQAIIDGEAEELEPFNPPKSFGLHCMKGTIGAAIAYPIEQRLRFLETQCFFTVTRFLKTNFSGPQAGIEIPDGVKVASKHYRNEEIYEPDAKPKTYLEFFKEKAFEAIMVTGICADVCVQQAAEGLKADPELKSTPVIVLDAFQHHLVVAPFHTYDSKRDGVNASYNTQGVEVLELEGFRSNPDLESQKYEPYDAAEDFGYLKHVEDNAILAFYFRHTAACNAVIAAIAVAAVVTIASLLSLGTVPLFVAAFAIVVAVVASGVTGFGTLFYQRNEQAKAAEAYEAEVSFTIS